LNQNSAPIRLVVPWKYGFKGAKSLARINFVSDQPKTLWNQMAPSEYGFYANVNPEVDHPRWSQKTERIIGGGFFSGKQPTLKFNGYEKEVAALYTGLDLRKNFWPIRSRRMNLLVRIVAHKLFALSVIVVVGVWLLVVPALTGALGANP
jgi:hypothetical protein